MNTTHLHGWGRFPVIESTTRASENLEHDTADAVLSRGLGRAYGDAALPPLGHARPVAVSTRADRILGFDPATGVMRAESGLSLSALADVYLPRGWFTPVSPGTQYVTLGGMVAADIHGKNHHVDGTIGNFVRSLKMRVADGRVLHVDRERHGTLFAATLGGMGLTGHILEVELKLEPIPTPWIHQESQQVGSLREAMEVLADASADWPMTVAWVDTSVRGRTSGRGIVTMGRWAAPDEAPDEAPGPRASVQVPPIFPSGVMNPVTIRALNLLYFLRHGSRRRVEVVHPGAFFWQLDLATLWYRGYGRRGFTQYQCVLPRDVDVFEKFLSHFQRLGGSSFVTVLKDCGPQGEGLLSFPKEGTSMALDIPITTVERARTLIRELNAFVLDHGGRVYLAKDALTEAAAFRKMYPRWEEFSAIRNEWDPGRRLASAQSVRLFGS